MALVAALLVATLALGCAGGSANTAPEVDAAVDIDIDGAVPDAVDDASASAGADLDEPNDDAMAEPVETTDAGPEIAPVEPLAGTTWSDPELWAEPLADYIAAGEAGKPGVLFLRAIHDLAVFDDRLYLGYGDATQNMGSVTPIEFRYFGSPDQPAALSEMASDEEHLERYRVTGSGLLMAGIDATEDAWLGNVYRKRSGKGWTKHRNVPGGVHVHDLVPWGGHLWAVGSGATPEEWGEGNVYGHLWRSEDDLATFDIVTRVHNQGLGDARWTHLLPLGAALLLFGYRIGGDGNLAELTSGSVVNDAVVPFTADHPLASLYPLGTDPLTDGRGLFRGVDVTKDALETSAWVVNQDGTDASQIDLLANQHVVDAFHHAPTGEWLLLTHEDATWYAWPPAGEYHHRIYVTADFETFDDVPVPAVRSGSGTGTGTGTGTIGHGYRARRCATRPASDSGARPPEPSALGPRRQRVPHGSAEQERCVTPAVDIWMCSVVGCLPVLGGGGYGREGQPRPDG